MDYKPTKHNVVNNNFTQTKKKTLGIVEINVKML